MKINKWWIIGLATVIGIAAAIFVAEGLLKQRIKDELQIQTIQGDTLEVSGVDLGLLRGRVSLNDLVIRWNIAPQDSAKESLTYLLRGEVGKVHLRGLSFWNYLFNDLIQIDKLLIDSSSLDVYLLESQNRQGKASDQPNSSGEQNLTVHIMGLEFAPSRIRYFVKDENRPRFEADAIRLNMEDFHYPQRPDSGALFTRFEWEADGLRYTRADALSDLLVANSRGNSRDSSFFFSSLHFRPRYSKPAYSKRLKYKDSRLDIQVARGKMDGLAWPDLLSEGAVRARSLQVDSFAIEVYEDSRLPVNEDAYKSFYQEKLLNAGVTMAVDTTRFSNGTLTYEIRPEGPEEKTGVLKFQNMEASLTNITNDSFRIAERALLQVQVSTLVNGESELKAYFTFDLSDPAFAYTYSGNMRHFELPQFNSILRETSQMQIVAGEMQQLSYRVEADTRLARGEMRIDYNNLKIEWLDQHNRLAALAQKIVMREQNPKNGNYRVGQIYHEREPHRSFWNCYLKSLLSGLNSTAMPNLFLPEELDAKKEKK